MLKILSKNSSHLYLNHLFLTVIFKLLMTVSWDTKAIGYYVKFFCCCWKAASDTNYISPFDYYTQVEQKLFLCIVFNADNSEDILVLIKPESLKLIFYSPKIILDHVNLKNIWVSFYHIFENFYKSSCLFSPNKYSSFTNQFCHIIQW